MGQQPVQTTFNNKKPNEVAPLVNTHVTAGNAVKIEATKRADGNWKVVVTRPGT